MDSMAALVLPIAHAVQVLQVLQLAAVAPRER